MTDLEKTNPIRTRVVVNNGVQPPPRLLLGSVMVVFVLGIIGAVAALLFLRNRPSPAALLGLAIIIAPVVTVGTVLLAIIFRRQLPRRFPMGLVSLWAIVWVVGGAASIVVYRNSLAPGQRETVKSHLPFMKSFDPALPPPDSSLPTPAPDAQSAISPADLLSGSFGMDLGTAQPSPSAAVVEAQPTSLPPTAAPSTAEPTVEATASLAPTATQVATEQSTEAAVVSTQANISTVSDPIVPPHPVSHWLSGFTYVKQGWNECGPANITMALSYFGWKQGLAFAADYLKPDREDKNVNPWELVSFVNNESGVRSLTRVGGSMDLLKRFISNGFPVVIESVLDAEGYDWIGHYETVVGYDDSNANFYIYDSYVGAGDGSGLPKTYEKFDAAWQAFNRTFVVLYKQEDESAVRNILGDRADITKSAELAAETAREEALANPQNAFAYFNLGSSLTRMGDFERAAAAFDQARRLQLPWRITLYQFGPFEAYFNVGRFGDVLSLVDATMNNGGQYVEEIYYWQGKALAAEGDSAKAASAFRQALAHNPKFTAAQDALNSLPT